MVFMASVVAALLIVGWISPTQMGLRLDTFSMGIVVGLLCQLPLAVLLFATPFADAKDDTVKRGRMHLYAAPLDAPIAEFFWSGVVASSIVAVLVSFDLPLLVAGTLGVILAAGIHLTSHLGPMRYLVPAEEGHMGWVGFFITMMANRAAFVIASNIVAPILGHALSSLLGLVIWRMKGQIDSIF